MIKELNNLIKECNKQIEWWTSGKLTESEVKKNIGTLMINHQKEMQLKKTKITINRLHKTK